MSVNIIVGAQCGDEGKGKVVDYIAQENDVIIRFQGGDNAGHTVVNHYGTFKLHLIPCGIFNPNAISLIGTGMVVNPDVVLSEIEQLQAAGVNVSNLRISDRAHILMPYHRDLDSLKEQDDTIGVPHIGTTKRGIGPAYAGRANRINIRFGDLKDPNHVRQILQSIVPQINHQLSYFGGTPYDVEMLCDLCNNWYQKLGKYIINALDFVHCQLSENKNILFEGQLGVMKDLDLGTYPYVTSSNPIAAYAMVGTGIPLKKVSKIIGVAKAFSSQVGAGPFPTETEDSIFDSLRGTGQNIDDEFGARTMRPRRLGWLDIPVLKFANMINGFDELVICKLDKLDYLKEIKICFAYEYEGRIIEEFTDTTILDKVKPIYETLQGWQSPTNNISSFDDLPQNAKKYICSIEKLVGVPVRYIGVGPSRNDIIHR